MKILLNKYREGYRACTGDTFAILDDHNPYIKDTIAWQNFNKGYNDCMGRRFINAITDTT